MKSGGSESERSNIDFIGTLAFYRNKTVQKYPLRSKRHG